MRIIAKILLISTIWCLRSEVLVNQSAGLTKQAGLWLRGQDSLVLGTNGTDGSLDTGFDSIDACKKAFTPDPDEIVVEIEGAVQSCEQKLDAGKTEKKQYYGVETEPKLLKKASDRALQEIQQKEAKRISCIHEKRYEQAAACCRKIKEKPQGILRKVKRWPGISEKDVAARCTKGTSKNPQTEIDKLMYQACIEEERYNEAAKCCAQENKGFSVPPETVSELCS